MTYASPQDFIDAFGHEIVKLTNLYDATAITVNQVVLEQVQEKSKALIDALIAVNPEVAARMPFSAPYPRLLVACDLDMTRYYLDSLEAREDVRLRYEDAIKNLRLIGEGKMALWVSESPAVVTDSEKLDANWDTPRSLFFSEGGPLC